MEVGWLTYSGMSEASSEGTTHSVRQEEQVAFSNWINSKLATDPDLSHLLPLDQNGENLYEAIKDGVLLCKIINLACPDTIDERAINKKNLTLYRKHENLTLALNSAQSIGCNIVNIDAHDLAKGKPHLVLGFIANLFNKYPVLDIPADHPIKLITIEETRAEKTWRNWINSLGVSPFVNHLYSDLADGLVLIQLFDIIRPGIVQWNRVHKQFSKLKGFMEKLENCNYCVELGKMQNFSLFGIAGQDIAECNKLLVSALVWQLMRAYTLSILSNLAEYGKPVDESRIVEWVNGKLNVSGKSRQIRSFNDRSISTGLPVIDLVDSIKTGSVNYGQVLPGETSEEKLANSKYAISMARKIGAKVYALPEDIAEVKPKMVMTVFACLMAIDNMPNNNQNSVKGDN